jgi:hypothetical protein
MLERERKRQVQEEGAGYSSCFPDLFSKLAGLLSRKLDYHEDVGYPGKFEKKITTYNTNGTIQYENSYDNESSSRN